LSELQKNIKRILRDPIALAFAGVGILLLGIALHFNINPVDCGAVRGSLQQHPSLFLPLAVATVPAMFFGMLVHTIIGGGADHSSAYLVGAFASQIILYFVIGLATSGIFRFIINRLEEKRLG
jgi:hypothetical protein